MENLKQAKLVAVGGGRQDTVQRRRPQERGFGPHSVLHDLVQFAQQQQFVVTSTTGGHHLGRGHREGRAIDVRTRGKSPRDITALIRAAHEHGYWVNDERRGGNSAWSGPHLHIEQR